MCFIDNGDDSAPPSYGPEAGNLVNLQTLDGWGDVVFRNVEGGRFGGVVVKDELCEPSEKVSGGVGCVVWICEVCIELPRLNSGCQGPACR